MPLNVFSPSTDVEVVIAGWAGRDTAAVRHHIQELSAIGVPPPSQTPLFYRVAADRLTQDEEVTVLGPNTSGEVEPVLVWTDDGLLVGVGSDHTDRDSERFGVAIAKQLCPKIVGRAFWAFEAVEERWDQLILRSYREVDGQSSLYQEGHLSALLPPAQLIGFCRDGGHGSLAAGSVLFCGTVPTRGGIERADALAIELFDPVTAAALRHRYRVRELPIVT